MGMSLLQEAIDAIVEDTEMFGIDGACPVAYEPPNNDSRILLISGDNAGGKSLVCRFLSLTFSRSKIEFMRIGMEMRTNGGMVRTFIFGDEGRCSTGELTAHSVLGAIHNSKQRTHAHVVCLDEPDTGLSEGYQQAVGETLVDYASTLPEHAAGLVVVTHSRFIANALMKLDPHRFRVGDDLRLTREWIRKGPLKRSMEDLANLKKISHKRFLAVTKVQNARKAKK